MLWAHGAVRPGVQVGWGARGPDRALAENEYGEIVQVLGANTPWAILCLSLGLDFPPIKQEDHF